MSFAADEPVPPPPMPPVANKEKVSHNRLSPSLRAAAAALVFTNLPKEYQDLAKAGDPDSVNFTNWKKRKSADSPDQSPLQLAHKQMKAAFGDAYQCVVVPCQAVMPLV